MSLVDSHAHLDDPQFAADLPDVLARAREAGVDRIVTIGTDLESSRRARALAEREPGVWFAPGIHPHDADRTDPAGCAAALRELAAHPRAVAVGETGLDYVKNYASVPNQKALLAAHLDLALEAGKPLSIHCRDAHADLIAILRARPPLRGVIHCFTGTRADAEAYLELGFHLSIAGPVTYPSAGPLRETVRTLPLDRLMVETDCPLLPPQKFRGKRNEPSYVRYAAAEIANLLGAPLAAVEAATSRAAGALFGIAP